MVIKNKMTHLGRPLRVRLSMDDGLVEKPIYSIKAITTEKDKGINMVTLIKHHFNLVVKDIEEAFNKQVEEFKKLSFRNKAFKKRKPIEWTRDDYGKIISPFDKKIESFD